MLKVLFGRYTLQKTNDHRKKYTSEQRLHTCQPLTTEICNENVYIHHQN